MAKRAEFDVIIAGGGAAGLMVAGRLSRADPALSILVLEAGIDTRDNPLIVNPGFFLRNILPSSNTATFHKSRPSEHLLGRELIVPSGGCLGGGSSINFMVYSRPQLIDFDDWKTEGWSSQEMLKCLKKFENFQDRSEGIDREMHGFSGEFSISAGTNAQSKFQEDFFQACHKLSIPIVPDVQDTRMSDGVGKWNMWISNTGRRQDVPHSLIYPILDRGDTGLKIWTEKKVVRVIVENGRAVGVKYISAGSSKVEEEVFARKLVVVSSGALSTPLILQRSGIGSKEKLTSLGIDSIADIKGVGSNYEDHHVYFYPYRSTSTADETLDDLVHGRLTLEDALALKKANPTRNVLGWNGLDCSGKIRPTPEEVSQFPPELKEVWERDYLHRKQRPLMLVATLAMFPGDQTALPPDEHYFSFAPYTPYPLSRGSVHITGPSINDPPDFDAGFLNHPADVAKLVWGYKRQREIVRRMAHYVGPLEIGHPKFSEASKANYATVDAASKAAGRLVPIEYSAEDDKTIEDFIRRNISTAWHSMATCPMKPLNEGGVVDKDLNVYGISNLKLADLSICPSNVGANTYSTALAVGEKAAAIIAKDLGIPYDL